MGTIVELGGVEDFEEAVARPAAIIYKHSPRCGLSGSARVEMIFFAEGNTGVPVYQVDVVHQRALSRHIAQRLDIEHESPQMILVKYGRAAAWASHRGVTAHALERELARSGEPVR